MRSRDRLFLICVLGFMLILIFIGCFQNEEGKVLQVHIISGTKSFYGIAEGFIDKMEELGYEEGKDVRYHIHEVSTGSAEEGRILEEITDEGADLILAYPTGSALNAKNRTGGSIPVIFGLANLRGTTLIENVSRPGGNITGLRVPSTEVVLKRFEYLLKLVPRAEIVYTAYKSGYPANIEVLVALRKAATEWEVTLIEAAVDDVEEMRRDLEGRDKADIGKIDGILITADSLSQSVEGWRVISAFAAENGIPVSGGSPVQAETGAVMSISVDFFETGRLAGIVADKIFKGQPAGTIPVATASIAFVFNYRQAEILGLTVPEELLNLATRIIR